MSQHARNNPDQPVSHDWLAGARKVTMKEPPITHGGTDRGYKPCKCSECGTVEVCTPSRDFYTTTEEDGPLLCEDCFWQYARKKGTP